MEVAAKMVEEPFKLLIVDSVTALFRVDFSGSVFTYLRAKR